MPSRPSVAVVDDDESVRESLPDLLREFGFDTEAFSSADEFLQSESIKQFKILLLDVAMPGMSGFELQKELVHRGREIAIIYITARRDDDVRQQVLKAGAVECLYKPFSDTALQQALKLAESRS